MTKSLKTGHVPSERIIAVIDQKLGSQWPWTFNSGLAMHTESSPLEPLTRYWKGDDLMKMISPTGRSGGWIEFDLADRILCCLNLAEVWRDELLDIYLEVDLSTQQDRVRKAPAGSVRCARRGCANLFKPKMPWARYCSKACKSAEQRTRRNERTGQPKRYGTKYDSCPNGHDRSPENVAYRKSGSIYCRACNRESMARRYASDPVLAEKKRQYERDRRAQKRAERLAAA